MRRPTPALIAPYIFATDATPTDFTTMRLLLAWLAAERRRPGHSWFPGSSCLRGSWGES
jgi:hypothetical protein